jgi:hypothetical protein
MLANYIGWLQAAVVPRQPRQRGEEPTLEFVQWQLWDMAYPSTISVHSSATYEV